MAKQICEFACRSVEESLFGELIKNALEEHLLLEFTFEAVLKSLLREPTKSQTAKTEPGLVQNTCKDGNTTSLIPEGKISF